MTGKLFRMMFSSETCHIVYSDPLDIQKLKDGSQREWCLNARWHPAGWNTQKKRNEENTYTHKHTHIKFPKLFFQQQSSNIKMYVAVSSLTCNQGQK